MEKKINSLYRLDNGGVFISVAIVWLGFFFVLKQVFSISPNKVFSIRQP